MNWLLQIFDPATIGSFVNQFQSEMMQPAFWVAVGKIIWINVLLSGDNALVIALACRGLEPRHRLWGMILGAGAAVILRIIFTGIVATLMELPYLKLVGGLALLVIAVAAAANGSVPLLILGLAVSIPLIVAGAALIMALLNRLPILVWAGAALLGWIAGDVIATDPALSPKLLVAFSGPFGAKLDALLGLFAISPRFAGGGNGAEIVCAVLGVIIVLAAGSIWRRRRLRQAERIAPSAG